MWKLCIRSSYIKKKKYYKLLNKSYSIIWCHWNIRCKWFLINFLPWKLCPGLSLRWPVMNLSRRLLNAGHLGPVAVDHLLNCLSVGGSRGSPAASNQPQPTLSYGLIGDFQPACSDRTDSWKWTNRLEGWSHEVHGQRSVQELKIIDSLQDSKGTESAIMFNSCVKLTLSTKKNNRCSFKT